MTDLELTVALPARSKLYSLPPLGMGTGLVESLAGYLGRLAEAHLVRVADLLRCLARGESNTEPFKEDEIFNLMGARSRELNGLQQVAQRWSTLLGNQTQRASLDQLTLLPWRAVLTPRALSHATQWWCPCCLAEQLATGQPIHWPLLWSLHAVSVCPIHRRPLAERCARCQATVPSLTSCGHIGFCAKCDAWLGGLDQPDTADGSSRDNPPVTDQALHMANGALALLAASALMPAAVAIDKLVALLDHCVAAAQCRPVMLAKQLGLSSAALYQLMRAQSHMTIPALLRLLTCLGLDIADFVQQPVAALVSAGYLDHLLNRLPPKRAGAQHSKLNHGQRATSELLADVQAMLEAALSEADPPGLPSLARRVGLTTVKVLRSHFPHLCRAIVDKRQSRFQLEAARQLFMEIANSPAAPPPLHTIAAQLKTSPVTLHRLFPDEVAAIKARRRAIPDVAALRHSVEAFLTVDPPLPLRAVSRRIGVKLHHLRQHCPDLQQALVRRFKTYQHTRAVEREQRAVAAIRQAVTQLNAGGQFPTKSKVATMLGRTRRLILSKSESMAFSQMMHELGLQPR